jgi:hypothetical protein
MLADTTAYYTTSSTIFGCGGPNSVNDPTYGRSLPLDVKNAIEAMDPSNGITVDVTFDPANTCTSATTGQQAYLVTFLSLLGPVPLLGDASFYSDGATEVTQGVTEVQTVVLAGDADFVPEVQQFSLTPASLTSGNVPVGSTLYVSFAWNTVTPAASTVCNSSPTFPLQCFSCAAGTAWTTCATNLAAKIQTYLNALPSSPKNPSVVFSTVTATVNDITNVATINIEYTNPVGDVPYMIDVATCTGSTCSLSNSVATLTKPVESIKGVSPVTGTFTIFFEGQYTDDIPHDASASQVKAALEDLSTIGMVSVVRDGPDTASYSNLPIGSPSARQTSTTATNVGTVTSATVTVASTAGATVGYPITVIGTSSATDTATVTAVISATQVTVSKALTVTNGQTVTFGSAIPVTATSGLPSGGFSNGFKWTISFIQNVGNLRML